jgi:hypothetical protein
LGTPPLLSGSGKFGTPCERIQEANPTSPVDCGLVPAEGPATFVDVEPVATAGGFPPPQPAASSEHATTATTDAMMSGGRERSMFEAFQSTASKAHHRNLNVSALRLRGC